MSPRAWRLAVFAASAVVWGVLIAVAINVAAITLADIALTRSHPEWLNIEEIAR